MSSEACRSMRELMGAYVLGSLDAERRSALVAHLDGCPECRAEVAELATVARALPLADPLRSGERPHPPEHLGDAILDRIAWERVESRRNRFRRASVTGLAAVAVVAAIVVVAGIIDNSERVSLELAASGGGGGDAVLEYHRWGTEISLEIEGLPEEEVYGVWLESPTGDRVPAGTFWTPEEGGVDVTLAAAMNLRDCKGLGISDEDGKTVMHSEMDWP
jgi:Anti-sigma-K factor rskA/Putative zinc-finger